jgi:hypothetical protein
VFHLLYRFVPALDADIHLYATLCEPFGRCTPAMFAAAPTVRLIGSNKYDFSQGRQKSILGKVA